MARAKSVFSPAAEHGTGASSRQAKPTGAFRARQDACRSPGPGTRRPGFLIREAPGTSMPSNGCAWQLPCLGSTLAAFLTFVLIRFLELGPTKAIIVYTVLFDQAEKNTEGFYLFLRFIYLFIWGRDRERAHVHVRGGATDRERFSSRLGAECGARHGARSNTLRSQPEPKPKVSCLTDGASHAPQKKYRPRGKNSVVFCAEFQRDGV